eukprot:4978903-Pyramimonas_sp.AAC.1
MFHARTLVASPAYIGPAGGCAGGVAMLIPHGTTPLHSEDLVPGCADASTCGAGVVTAPWDSARVRSGCEWEERWRFKWDVYDR